jgi:hypothetical protein
MVCYLLVAQPVTIPATRGGNVMSKRKPFLWWLLEKFIEYGNADGGLGWMMFWVIGLEGIAVFDILILHSQGSIYFNSYLILTAIGLIVLSIKKIIYAYMEETKNEGGIM